MWVALLVIYAIIILIVAIITMVEGGISMPEKEDISIGHILAVILIFNLAFLISVLHKSNPFNCIKRSIMKVLEYQPWKKD
jgi:cytochrome c biogenesis factor